MKMKLYFASAIMALSWISCNQEEVVNDGKGNAHTICAIIEGTSRSTVTDAGVFSWASGDQISIHAGSNHDIYTYSGSGNDFTEPNTINVSAPEVAYYPANENHTTTQFYLPVSYGDVNTEYVANTHAAMIATPPTEGDTYAFMHLGGVMRFVVKNLPEGANKFSFKAVGKQITGSFTVNETDGVKTISTTDVTGEENQEVTIYFKPLDTAQDMTFYVPMPTDTYGDYNVTIGINGGSDITRLSTGVTNTISRKTLLLMPTFTYDAANGGELVKGEAVDNVIRLVEGNGEATITNDGDVVVIPGNNADATATLNYTPAEDGTSTLTISDGSAEGTTSSDSEGKVVVATANGTIVASCEIDAPTLSVKLSAAENETATYTQVTANTAIQTLIIGKGVTVTTLIINGGNVIIEEGATVSNLTNYATDNTISYLKLVSSVTELKEKLEAAGSAGAGDTMIGITKDLDMTNIDWTPIYIDGYHGADIVTIEGYGHSIKGLNAGLFKGGFAGGSGLVIKNLTIEKSTIVADNTQGYGAFVGCADSMDEITLINCHLKESTIITPNDGADESRIGGLIGWTAGYNNQNDGPVDSYITVKDCSVIGCTLKGAGSIGGIVGHAGANAATFTTIENCILTNNNFISTDDGDWRVGVVVGTANNGQCNINNITESENTLTQTGKTAPTEQSNLYGRFVPSGTGTLIIDGKSVSN